MEHLQLILDHVPPNAQLILGDNVNAKLGCHDSDELLAVLGPQGPLCRNVCGSNLLALYLSHKTHPSTAPTPILAPMMVP
jgi:hypothetical protein